MWIVLTLFCIPLSHWHWPPFICASHADFHWSQSRSVFAKATRAVGEDVKFSTEFDSMASCTDLLHHVITHWNSKLSEKRFTFTKNQWGGETQLDRRSRLKITVDGNQSCVPAQKTKYLKPAKATGFNPTCALSLLDPLNVKHCDNRSWQK